MKHDNWWTRLDDWLDRWYKKHLPDWLYKVITFQHGSIIRPYEPSDKPGSNGFIYFLIVAAIIALVISIFYQAPQ
jgi:hypothetical protein